MLLYCRGESVLATHDEAQDVDAVSAYGAGAYTLTAPAGFAAVFLPCPIPETSPDLLRQYAAAARYAKEVGGITAGGAHVATDRASQAMISGAWCSTQLNPSFTTQWKNADGSWSTLTAAQITGIATAVSAHVAACFAEEKSLDDGIAAGTVTTTAEIDEAFATLAA